jgi:hypothetical protein
MAQVTLSNSQLISLLALFGIGSRNVAMIVVRGGVDGSNEIGTNDDKFYIRAGEEIRVVRGNADPSVYRPKMARVVPNKVFWFVAGLHHKGNPSKARPAFRQYGDITVNRVSTGLDTGYFGINWHDQLGAGTSSAGCLTITKMAFATIRDWLYGKLGVTMDQVKAGVEKNPFPYVILNAQDIPALLAKATQSQGVAKPADIAPKTSTPLRAKYTLTMPGGDTWDNANTLVLAGHTFVPVRSFSASLLNTLGENVPLKYNNEAGGDSDTLYLAGKQISEYALIDNRAWVYFGEICECLGFEWKRNDETKTVTIQIRAQI